MSLFHTNHYSNVIVRDIVRRKSDECYMCTVADLFVPITMTARYVSVVLWHPCSVCTYNYLDTNSVKLHWQVASGNVALG